ncbi:MAG: outer membrane beta-barrel protein [Parvibaculum sp.]|uniref:outer membrane beta-barrel protein n=1 Tax=Parvibaculum sp. TaxID=2024848 RepID=UPI002718C9DA|nr:outer membrane beta-barrel protein [Parvibaculum sp.]MDO8837349.1 outer membrane beta-barrel protein [Parvibaculum sp.]
MSASLLSKTLIAAVAASALYALPTSVAEAQGYGEGGIRAGAFMVYPEASVTAVYNDNVFAADVGAPPPASIESDFITTLAASVSAESGWSRHALNLNAGLSQKFYQDNTGDDRFGWNIGGDGRVDITRDTSVSAGLSYTQTHEDRDFPDAVANAAEPTEFSVLQAEISLDHRFNRVTTRVGAGYADYDYDNVPLIGGGVFVQDDRDYERFNQFVQLGYDVSPDTNVYIRGTLNQRKYDQQPPVVATDRDSDGYSVVGGAEFRVTNLVRGGVYAGYQEQSYDDPTLPEISGLSYGANLDWSVTPLTTIRLEAAATIEETTTVGASGYMAQSVGIGVDHELTRDVTVGARASYGNNDYEGVGRSDDIIRAGVGVDYLINRNFSVGLAYDYTERSSNVPGLDFDRNEVGLTLKAKL